ncbi:phosphoribosylformylglycinamidine cyclo-ligase [Rossellomorea vietnamensis]|uniref:Phosphoribosylformylglycinamidine cyclo-ligase n=1 Tax=Rossellomorea vietnamensis TaxID=218284 RepID=A0A5D4NTZ6_9BACI|nr:phosphoribosylformylglycinamidine cyclo-ligase [Rossellomorea vietnamensis]TYS16928.1 phosphoribosylformylglycinamidine cyclo-ligase [Rossellomorea vietnamensis]
MANAYKNAGVDIDAGYESVNRIKKHVERTKRKGMLGSLGGFGGMFDLSELGLKKPVLVSGTDGVGTKLKLAFMADRHDTIGIDCVAMCVNDIIVQGAEPLYFLDYIACGKAVPEKIESIVKGIADGCEMAGAGLVGGETAEMPGLYEIDEYDIAGFAVGACEKSSLITGDEISEGNMLVGLASSGIHSNGYSLVRKIFFNDHSYEMDTYMPQLGSTLGEALLTPTKIYVKPVLAAIKKFSIKGMSHITGGGFIENIPRMLPEGLGAEINASRWELPELFKVMEELGSIPREEMYNIFNMGIGFVMAVDASEAEAAVDSFKEIGEEAYLIGKVTSGGGVQIIEGEGQED